MRDEFWSLKVTAFLHDPPDKCLGEKGTAGHVSRAQEYIALLLKEELSKREIQRLSGSSDAIAATAERLPFPKWQTLSVNFLHEEQPEHSRWVVHPLSGQARQLPDLGLDEATSHARETLQEIQVGANGDARRVYLGLWRTLPWRLGEKSQAWLALPADTRIPDHTIWHHMDAVAALAPIYERKSQPTFLLFSIGPVQDFIAAARTTRDLWTGSLLLSYLIWQGIKVVVEACGPDAVIFPSLRRQPLVDLWLLEQGVPGIKDPSLEERVSPSFPNKFLALVPQNQAEQLARQAKDAIARCWKSIASAVHDEIVQRTQEAEASLVGWDSQVESLFECHALAMPWPNAEAQEILRGHQLLLGSQAATNIEVILKTQDRIPIDDRDPRNLPIIGNCWSLFYEQVSRLSDARKIIRSFAAWQGDSREKDTLDGLREQMGPCPHEGVPWHRSDTKQFWDQLRESLRGRTGISARLGPHERLSAVNVVKRFAWDCYLKLDRSGLKLPGDYRLPFPSTASIAVANWKKQVIEATTEDTALKIAIQDYCQTVQAFIQATHEPDCGSQFEEIDGEWLFKESFTDERAQREQWSDEAKALLPACREVLKKLQFTVSEATTSDPIHKGLGAPPKYFAVLFFDGDEIGKWLSGKNAPKLADVLHPKAKTYFNQTYPELLEANRPLGLALHASISEALANFSLHLARHIVETRHQGKLIYSGGDDALALLPIGTALRCSRALRAAFSDWNSDNGGAPAGFYRLDQQDFLTMGPTATASVGLAIAHYMHPLQAVLEEGRKALELAKERYGRDALCISVLKRSGERLITGTKWKINGLDVVDAIDSVSQAFQSGKLSSRLPYRLRQEFAPVLRGDGSDVRLPTDLIRSELGRLVKRPRKDLAQNIRAHVLALASSQKLDELLDQLLVASFLTRAGGE